MAGLRATEVMGLEEDATVEVVRERYKYLARVLHPDKSGSTALFQLVGHAYAVMIGEEEESPRRANPRANQRAKPKPRSGPPPKRAPQRPPKRDPRPPRPPRPFMTVDPTPPPRPTVNHAWPNVQAKPTTEPEEPAPRTPDEPDDWSSEEETPPVTTSAASAAPSYGTLPKHPAAMCRGRPRSCGRDTNPPIVFF